MSSGKDRQGDLWDDSVLINAFNDAISKYKKMHNMEQKISSSNPEKAISSKEDLSNVVDHAHDDERHAETNDDRASVPKAKSETDDTGNKTIVQETSCLESGAPEKHLNSSNGQYFQHEPTVHPNLQGPEDYNQLLNKYYELEDQRQKILQQLSQFGYGSYNFDYGTAASEQNQTSAYQAHWGLTSVPCPYGCQSWITPCTTEPSCCFSKACARKSGYALANAACSKDSASLEDTDIDKTANAAAKRALSSLKEQVANTFDASVTKGKEKQSETHGGDLAKSTSSETDITEVLNAWYSAGFYTGKYLTEQSLAKNRHC